jgi:hypothetical protein
VKTDDLINALSQDAPVRWRFSRALALAVGGGALVAGGLFFALMGPRPDFMDAAGTVRFVFKFVLTVILATTATGLILRLAQPGTPTGGWRWALILAPVLLAIAVVAELMIMPAETWGTRLVGTHVRFCLTLIPMLAIGPLALLLLALRQGAPTHPGLAGAVAGLAASGIAATFYAANCTDDSPLFVATWYPIAIGFVTLVGYLVGRRTLSW